MQILHNNIPALVARNVSLSIGVEPIAKKEGLTTRLIDSSEKAKLIHFLVGAANVQIAFEEMAIDYLENKTQPKSIFHYGLKSQQLSVLHRGGSKVTFGQCLLLTVVVSAHLRSIAFGNKFTDIEGLFDSLDATIDNCSKSDVTDLFDFCSLSIEQSRNCNESLGLNRSYPELDFINTCSTVKECFCSGKAISRLSIVKELNNGCPQIKKYFMNWGSHQNSDLLEYTETIYPVLLKEYGRGDIAADLICVIMYTIISSSSNEVLFP